MKQTVKDTLFELSKKDSNSNVEWIERFEKYAVDIEANIDRLKESSKKFHIRKPFNVYLNLSQTKDSSDVFVFSLRYMGQEVADLKVNLKVNLKDSTVVIDTSNYDSHNKEFFNCPVELKNADWAKDSLAKSFRKYFLELDINSVTTHSKEHEYESLLLSEFNKSLKTQFRGIKPISIIKARFPMKTPLLASKTGVKLEGRPGSGGGIDLFTRTKTNGQVRLNVMELKDEYESPENVIKQAIKYAVFIQQLLRSKSGSRWWKLFGFCKPLPEKLIINATCIMPENLHGANDTSFANRRLDVNGDTIELHYIYFTHDSLKVVDSSI